MQGQADSRGWAGHITFTLYNHVNMKAMVGFVSLAYVLKCKNMLRSNVSPRGGAPVLVCGHFLGTLVRDFTTLFVVSE